MTHTDERPLRAVPPDEPPFDPYPDQPPTPKSEQNGRQLPHDYDAERAVLATLLASPNPDGTHPGETLATLLEPGDFYLPEHEAVWTTWHQLHATTAVPPDAVTLNAQLVRARDERAVRALAGLVASTANPLLAEHHAKIVRDAARLRVVDSVATGLRDLVTRARADQVEHYLGEALQRLDETVTRFGPSTTQTSTGLADLSWILTGTRPAATPPVYGRRQDGTALFYAGRHNGVFGDPESGKTWLAQIAGVEALTAGQTFAMVDVDHNGQDHTAARLALLGVPWETIANPDRFRYYEPEDADQLRAAIADITHLAPAVTLIDSLGEILPMLGVKSVDNDEITAALRTICMPPAKAGSCVISVDHLPKSHEARITGYAIGGTAKKRAVDGAYLRVEAKIKPAPDSVGRVMLRIEKDRTGELRRSSEGGYAGTFVLDSSNTTGAAGTTTWSIGREEIPRNDDGTLRPTGLMEKVASYVAENDGCSQRDIELNVPGKDRWVRDAIKILVAEGFIARQPGPRRSTLHTLLIPYREAEDDHAIPTD